MLSKWFQNSITIPNSLQLDKCYFCISISYAYIHLFKSTNSSTTCKLKVLNNCKFLCQYMNILNHIGNNFLHIMKCQKQSHLKSTPASRTNINVIDNYVHGVSNHMPRVKVAYKENHIYLQLQAMCILLTKHSCTRHVYKWIQSLVNELVELFNK